MSAGAPGPARPLSGWGRHPVIESVVTGGEDLVRASEGAILARGLGRSYGDAALPPVGSSRPVARSPAADRILAFDPETGVLRAEAGLSLRDLVRTFLGRGWFSPVSTGTQYVTLGGMVASDVHGKNHHVRGTFGQHVRALRIRVGTGDILDITPASHPDLFWATVGGMGLTGAILEVEVQLEGIASPWILERSARYDRLEDVFEALTEASRTWPMTAAWVDTSARGDALGRGILYCGRWAEPSEAPRGLPVPRRSMEVPDVFPSGVMNRLSVRTLNAGYHWVHGAAEKQHVIHPEGHFYQLDLLTEWNRGYGGRGFTQMQCVLPKEPTVHRRFLERFQALGGCSFVTVFKDCGPEGDGLLSFPKEGTSLALDIPVGRGTADLIRELNAFVIDHGGRIYLAKDAFTTAAELRRMYPRLDAFLAVREKWDPDRRIQSAQSVRLMGF